MPPVRFAEPSTWRKYHWPRDSPAVSSTVNSCVPSGKWPQKMIMYDHTLRIRLAVRLPGEDERRERAGQQREGHVVLQRLPAGLLPDLAQRLALVAQPDLTGADALGFQLVQRDAVLEQHHQQERVHRVAQVVRLPALVLAHPQDAVADVAVHPDDVGVGVVHVVVRVPPLVGRAGGVPLEVAAGDRRVTHPVVLAVHDVVADLHVVQDLRDAQHRGARPARPAAGTAARGRRLPARAGP